MPDLSAYIRDVPDFPKPGIVFKDITPLLGDPAAFGSAVERLAEPFADRRPDAIAAIEARGFLFAAPLALRLGAALVPIRKSGKLPGRTLSAEYQLEYGTDRVEMHADAIRAGQRVLLVDDVLATGGTMKAAVELVRGSGAEIAACAFLIELGFLGGRSELVDTEIVSLLTY